MASAPTHAASDSAIRRDGTVKAFAARPRRRHEVVGELARYLGAVAVPDVILVFAALGAIGIAVGSFASRLIRAITTRRRSFGGGW